MIGEINVKIMGESKKIAAGLTYQELANEYKDRFKFPIVLAKVGYNYKELNEIAVSNEEIEFVDLKDFIANKAYVNGLIHLIAYSAEKTFGPSSKIFVMHSIDKGIYITTNFELTPKKLEQLKAKMTDFVEQNLSITKCRVLRDEAIEYYKNKKDYSKVNLLKYNTHRHITLYKLGNNYDYFFSLMPASTGVLNSFDLHFLNNRGFVLLFPTLYKDEIKPYEHHQMIFDVFSEYNKWASIMKISNIPDLNKFVSSGRADDIIRIEEVLQSNRLLFLARDIVMNRKETKVILMAGPSSSGKTTTCKKLSMYLRAFGLEPRELSMDDYFFNREDTPKDENGEYDFECLEAIDIKSFDKDVKDLINGKGVKLPTFNFITGERVPGVEDTYLGENEVLIIEGIHALSDKILTSIDKKKKFRIYLAPLAVLTIDSHNRVSTTDIRLLRRIVRDNRTRGYNAENTLGMWRKVRQGEEKHIFPNQDSADAVVNTSMIYELGVLKAYAEPLLFSVASDSPNYKYAIRLINMLKPFLPITSDAIPDDSIIREFIGGSCYK